MSNKIVHKTLLILVVVNIVWSILFHYPGPLFGALLYGCIFIVCLKRHMIHPALIAGIFGLVLHLIELILFIRQGQMGMEIIVLIMNVVLPIPLVYFSWKMLRIEKRSSEN